MAVLGPRFCARALPSCGKRGPPLIAVRGPLTIAASLAAEHRLQTHRLSNCGPQAQFLHGMRDPPRPGLEPVSPALAGRLPTTAPPGKPCLCVSCICYFVYKLLYIVILWAYIFNSLRYNGHFINCTYLMYNLMFWHMNTPMETSPQSRWWTYPKSPKLPLCPFVISFSCSYFQITTSQLSITIDEFAYSRILELSRITQYILFFVWLLPLSLIILSFKHVVAHISSSSFFISKQYPDVQRYHAMFI